MSKKDKDKKKAPRTAHSDRDTSRDWEPLFERLSEVVDWALDITAKISRDYEEDLVSIARVREFVHGWLEGRRAEIPLTDLLTTIAILFSAIELDLGIDSVSLLAPLRTMLDTPSVLPALLRCPGVRDKPSVVIRRLPGRDKSRSSLTHLAA